MKFYLETSGFINLFDNTVFNKLKENFPEIEEKKIKLCISPLVLEEFFYTLMYKKDKDSRKIFSKFVGNAGLSIKEKIGNFFSAHGEKFYEFLEDFEIISVGKETSFIFKENILKSLTRRVGTYDLLHIYLSSKLDGIVTADRKLADWVKNNSEQFQFKKGYLIICYSLKSKNFEIFGLEEGI